MEAVVLKKQGMVRGSVGQCVLVVVADIWGGGRLRSAQGERGRERTDGREVLT
jgi:hypothetical protein